MSENNDEKIKKQMKQRLENLPRYTYKAVGYFTSLHNMQCAIDDLTNKGIMDLSSRTLDDNYIEEIYENSPFFRKELFTFINSFIISGIIGVIIGGLVGKQDLIFPVLDPILAGGRAVCVFLGFFLGAAIGSTMISILSLYRPFSWAQEGYHMLAVYSDIEQKQLIQDILKKNSAIKQ